jgi:hypothetical protein
MKNVHQPSMVVTVAKAKEIEPSWRVRFKDKTSRLKLSN